MPGIRQIILQQFAEPQDRIHRRADLMAHVGQKNTFLLVAVFRLQFFFHQFLLPALVLQGQPRQPEGVYPHGDGRKACPQTRLPRLRQLAADVFLHLRLAILAHPVQSDDLVADAIHEFFAFACGQQIGSPAETAVPGGDQFDLPGQADLRLRMQCRPLRQQSRLPLRLPCQGIKTGRQVRHARIQRFEEFFVAADNIPPRPRFRIQHQFENFIQVLLDQIDLAGGMDPH